jgi:hypothetical protein
MPAEFTMGARASCIDGFCGEVRRTILDPAAGTITHLVVEHRHPRGEPGRLVPVGLASVTEGEIRLSCTLAPGWVSGPTSRSWSITPFPSATLR